MKETLSSKKRMTFIVVALVLCICRCSAWIEAAPTIFKIVLMNDQRFAGLDQKDLKSILEQAKRILGNIYELQIEFDKVSEVPIRAFLDEQKKRISPYSIPPEHLWNPFDLSINEVKQIASRLAHDNLSVVQQIAETVEPVQIPNEDAATQYLERRFNDGIKRLKVLRDIDGQLAITPRNWIDYSLLHWELYLGSNEWGLKPTLYLSGLPLLDDAKNAGVPSTMASGGIANFYALPASSSAYVSWFAILNDNLGLITSKDRRLTQEEKHTAIAYVIAQSIGSGVLRPQDLNFESRSGILRPLFVLKNAGEWTDIERMKTTTKLDASPTVLRRGQLSKTLLRIDVFTAQKEWKKAADEADRAFDLPFNKAEMQEVFNHARQAYDAFDR